MEFAARMIVSLLIISACILRGVGVASNDDNFCGSDITNLHAPCLLPEQTVGVPLNTDRVSRTAKILMPTDLANSLPPKNFSLKSLDHSISIGDEITTDYFSVKVAKRWYVSLSFSTLPNELKNITLVQLIYTVENFTGVDEFLSAIHIHVNDSIYAWQFLLFHKQDLMSSESTSTTSTMPSESENSSTTSATPSESVSSSTTPDTSSESVSSSTTPDTSSESESKPYLILLILLILSIIVNVVLSLIIIAMVNRLRSQNRLLRRIAAIHQYIRIPQRDSSSPGEASTDLDTHEMEVRVPVADTNQDSGNLQEQDESHQIPTTEGSPCSGQANGETCVVDMHQTERVDPTEQRQPEAESNLHAPTEACTGTLSALGDEKTETEEDIADLYKTGIPETQEIQAQEELIQVSDSDDPIMG